MRQDGPMTARGDSSHRRGGVTTTRRGRVTRRLLAVLSSTAMLLAPSLMSAPPASAGDDICTRLGYGANCVIDFGNPSNSGGDGDSGPGRPPCNLGAPDFTGVPCSGDAGLWSNAWQCYVYPMSPPPDPSDPQWSKELAAGKTVYDCAGFDGKNLEPSKPRAIKGDPPTVIGSIREIDTREFVGRALGIRFESLIPSLAPRPTPRYQSERGAATGVVGAQVWMWALQTAYTPFYVEASGAGGRYWVKAKITHTRWDMDDGSPVKTCQTWQMKVYDESLKNETPRCGHKYTKPGRYYVMMWTHFRVEWNDVNGPGGREIIVRRGVVVRVGESQVIGS